MLVGDELHPGRASLARETRALGLRVGPGEPGDGGSVDPLQCLVELAPAGQESCCRSQAAIPSGSSVALTLKPMVAMTRVQ